MKITIDKAKTILDIQKEFTNLFAFLKIEFFTRPHGKGMGSEKRFMKEGHSLLTNSGGHGKEGVVEIDGEMTVTELERLFEENFNLYVQVFRRSGKLWLETTATDNWTLNYQNEQGRELSSRNFSGEKEDIDYHEQE